MVGEVSSATKFARQARYSRCVVVLSVFDPVINALRGNAFPGLAPVVFGVCLLIVVGLTSASVRRAGLARRSFDTGGLVVVGWSALALVGVAAATGLLAGVTLYAWQGLIA